MARAVIFGVLAGFGVAVLAIILLKLITMPESTAARLTAPTWKLVEGHVITQSLMVAGWALACAIGGSVAARRIPERWLEACFAVSAILLLLGPLPEAVFNPRTIGPTQIAYLAITVPVVLAAGFMSARRRRAEAALHRP
jgi:hypothetical protein